MIIGLTGQIGSGKTAAAKILAELGAVVIDADQIGRQVVEASQTLRRRLARAFGPEILDKQGRIKRKKLAAVAFADENSRNRLNALVHPPLLRELRRQLKRVARAHPVVVIDAALLLHWRMDSEVDFVLVIHASRAERLRRMQLRGFSAGDVRAREKAQLGYREFQQRADRLILNNGAVGQLERRLKTLFRQLTRQTN